METGTASCFAPLAADRLRRLPFARPTSSRKTRVRDFCAGQSGRFSSRRRRSGAIATGCRACGYKTASGRSKWLNRDPLGEPGFEVLQRGLADVLGDGPNLYAYVKNDPTDRMDPRGLDGEATLGLDPTLLMDEEEAAAFRAQQCKCAALRAAVVAAKAAVGALGGPKSGDSCAVLKVKTAAWLALAVARSRQNQVCFGGGDPGHQQATADAWKNVANGIALQTEKGCVGSPTR